MGLDCFPLLETSSSGETASVQGSGESHTLRIAVAAQHTAQLALPPELAATPLCLCFWGQPISPQSLGQYFILLCHLPSLPPGGASLTHQAEGIASTL